MTCAFRTSVTGLFLVLSTAAASAGCNSGSIADSVLLTTSSCSGHAPGVYALAVGAAAYARGENALSLGAYAGPGANVPGAISIGARAGYERAGGYSVAIGSAITGTGAPESAGGYSVAIGSSNDAGVEGARANGHASIAISGGSTTADFGISVGWKTISGFAATAVGPDAHATHDSSVALGRFSSATSGYAAALGSWASATGQRAVAAGYQSQATGLYSVAVGTAARATQTNAVAVGRQSIANVANTFSVGATNLRRRIVNVANGTAANDAATLGQVQSLVASASRSMQRAQAVPLDELRQELADLRELVKAQQELVKSQQEAIAQQRDVVARQQERIAKLEGRATLASIGD